MVQLDFAVAYLLPGAKADISAGRRQKRVFKLGSIPVPGFVGLEELEGRRRERAVGVRCSVNQMPQTHDAGTPVRSFAALRFVPRSRERVGNWNNGSHAERNRSATASLGAGSRKQKRQSCHCDKGDEPLVPKCTEDIHWSHRYSPYERAEAWDAIHVDFGFDPRAASLGALLTPDRS